jgi:hypothetical protein
MFSKSLSSGYSFNAFKEIKSHSSVLYNERLAILFYILDLDMIQLNSHPTKDVMFKVKGNLYQIWKNVRCLIRSNFHCRKTLHLETKDQGVYTIDVAFEVVNQWIMFCDTFNKKSATKNNWTHRSLFIIIEHLNNIEIIMRDILQYFQYFIRAEFKQMPDILQAAEEYKRHADKLTMEQLRGILGKNNQLDFESLGIMTDEEYKQNEAVTEDDEEIGEVEDEL